jgi:hypothetical protein
MLGQAVLALGNLVQEMVTKNFPLAQRRRRFEDRADL